MNIDIENMLAAVVGKFPIVAYVLMVLGTIVVLAQVYVAMTPRKDDDAFVAKLESMPVIGHLLRALVKFAPFQRK